jgi:hypothetical protein
MASFGPDLLVNLSVNKYANVLDFLEGRISERIACRHEYPMWPAHGDNPYDAFEEDFHGRSRHVYYDSTKDMIHVLRRLRNLS